eukprot:gb/GFBE01067582.1/.p1 GENE.gb/GFBE01067582.1/~~gb/GFBE01067582.1/.p1  ORF type:complete len:168 (+),score=18.86 gb/GFBE01067582.1/:1-504(+)
MFVICVVAPAMAFKPQSPSGLLGSTKTSATSASSMSCGRRPSTASSSLLTTVHMRLPAFADGRDIDDVELQSSIDRCREFDERVFGKLCDHYESLDDPTLGSAMRTLRGTDTYPQSWLLFTLGGFAEEDMTPQIRGMILRDVALERTFRIRHSGSLFDIDIAAEVME